MKPVIIISVIVIPVIVAAIFAVFFIESIEQENPGESIVENESDKVKWQLYQKTYLEQECRELYLGQPEELQDCYDRIDEEQRLNPPTESEP